MTVAVVTLALIVAGLGAGLVFVTRWGMKSKDEAQVSADLYREQERRADGMQFERDEWKKKHDVVTQQLAVAKVRLATAEVQRNQSYQAATNAIVEKVRASNAQTASDVVNDLLRLPLGPVLPKAGDPGSGDGNR
jgi:hypothetical protein